MPNYGSAELGPDPLPDVMTIEQLCSYLQLSRSTLYKLAQEGKVPGQKVGKHWRFKKDVIDRWLEENPEGRER
jgi:excisionase family DNA binding protein